ncbi:RloB domain-containing protein [Chitinophaga sp. RCC_12]|uniref:RloB domain-containing protein n=1 Tax=Chitinophaga sp. RCC_12 TaxID=3239226 RepID=UPI003523D0CD
MRQKRAIAIKARKTFAVVVDGDTEVWYLQMLKRNERSINVNIEPKIPQRKRLSEQFEMILLHFERTSKYFSSCEGAEKQLKKHLKDYKKTQKYYTKQNNDIYLQLKSKLATAINNAKQLGCFNPDTPQSAISEMPLFFEANKLEQLF